MDAITRFLQEESLQMTSERVNGIIVATVTAVDRGQDDTRCVRIYQDPVDDTLLLVTYSDFDVPTVQWEPPGRELCGLLAAALAKAHKPDTTPTKT